MSQIPPQVECGTMDVLYIHPKCHPQSPTWTRLHKDGHAEIVCATCNNFVVRFPGTHEKQTPESAARVLSDIKLIRTAPPYLLARLKKSLNDFNAAKMTWRKS